MVQGKRSGWEDDSSDNESQNELEQSPETVTTRKRTIRKAVPRSLVSTTPLTNLRTARGQRQSPRDKIHSKRPVKSLVRRKRWHRAAFSALCFPIVYIFGIIRVALVWLRKPLALLLACYLLSVLVSRLLYTFSDTLRTTLAPLCVLPVVSRMPICHSPFSRDLSLQSPKPRHTPRHADYPALVQLQSVTFEALLDESVGGAGLALEIKKAEMATSDLTTLVRVSGLMSKDTIAETLDVFVEGARRTSRGLQRFSAKVGGAVDGIVAVNDYALKRIDAVTTTNSFLDRWPSVSLLLLHRSPPLEDVTKSFTQSMSVLESELHNLILAAEASLHDLDVLEEQLRLLHMLVSREDQSLSTSKQELLSSLWTFLGGNRAELHRFESHLKLLSGLAEYRQRALAHVVGALHTLQAMSAELEALRERVSQPVMLGGAIPLEVHVESIRGGLDRLKESRLKAKRIEEARYAKLLAPLEK